MFYKAQTNLYTKNEEPLIIRFVHSLSGSTPSVYCG